MTREQGAEKSNLGSMEPRVCHKIMVFYTVEIFRLASLGILVQTDFNSGSKITNIQGARRCQNRFKKHENLFWGASRK